MGANFRSDNETPVAPEIMAALTKANAGMAHSYGDDALSARVGKRFSDVFERQVTAFPVVSGTAANALAVAQITPSWGAVICHEDSHLHTDECGAPEFFSGGAKLITLPGKGAKLNADDVRKLIDRQGEAGDHASQPMLLSLTQASEFGTVYSLKELRSLSEVAHDAGLRVHMDGARFANALVTLGCTPAAMTWKAGIDIVSFGATKNGAMMAEALLFFDEADAVQLGRRRKQGAHLISKMRYVSAQLDAYLEDDLWLHLAGNANAQALRLADGLDAIDGIDRLYPVQSNEVFVGMSAEQADLLRDAGFEFHGWPGRPGVYRLVTAHCTSATDVDSFIEAARQHRG